MATNSQHGPKKSHELEWAKLIEQCRLSGSSVKTFCQERGIKESAYYYWQKRIKQKESKKTGFVEIREPWEISGLNNDDASDIASFSLNAKWQVNLLLDLPRLFHDLISGRDRTNDL